MKRTYKGIIFDLDGTLVDTLGDIAASMNRALADRGFPELPAEAYRSKVGWGIKRLAFLALPEKARDEETAALVAGEAASFYAETPLLHSKPYAGIPELLAELTRRKVKTSVLTNKPDPVAQKVIAGLFPRGAFGIVQGEVSGRPRKPDPSCVWDILVDMDADPAEVVFAGDSEIDMETALAAGCFPLGVDWGYRPRETMEEAGAKRVIVNPRELLEFFGGR